MPRRYDQVEFKAYDPDTDATDVVATVYLMGDTIVYEGTEAKQVEEMIKKSDSLKPYRKMGGYSLLAQLPHEFSGSYFYATPLQEASIF